MALPSGTVPNVTTNQLIASSDQNTFINGYNSVLTVLGPGTNPAGSYSNVTDAIAGKLDLSGSSAMTGAIDMGSNAINNLATPLLSTDAATKQYVDASANGWQLRADVRVLASSNVVLSTGGLLTIDSVGMNSGDRVLCVGQTNAAENGIYAAASGAWSRTSDANTSALVPTGMYAFVTSGTTYANQGWALITPGPITLGTTLLTFTQVVAAHAPGAATGANHDITSMYALSGVLEAPTQVNDANGNAVVAFGSTASAVNSVQVTNAATTTAPTVSAVGTDTNIGLNLSPKGTGITVVNSSAQVNANGSPGILVKSVPANTGVSPSTITGLLLWLKADAITGYSSGSALTTWSDSSGVGNNATASTTAPTYYTDVLNGLPAVYFDGTDDTMTLGTLISTARTVFWVAREVPSTPSARPFLGATSTSDFVRGSGGQYWSGSASAYVTNGLTRLNGTVVAAPTTTQFPQGPFQIVSLVTTGGCRTNQITENQSTSSQIWYGHMAEIIIYNSALSDSDRSNIEAYLANKYALPLTTPAAANLLEVHDPGNNEVFIVTGGGGQQVKLYTFGVGSTYAATSSDYIIVVNKTTGSATSVTLPASPNVGQLLVVKDGKGDAGTNNITITPSSGTIDGASSLVLSTNYAVARLVWNGVAWSSLYTVAREFSDTVLDHFKNPRHGRPLPWPDGTGWAQNHDRSRYIRIQVCLEAGRVSQIGFSTHGCAPAIACGSWVCEWAFERPLEAVNRLTAGQVLEGLGRLPEHRHDHADLSVQALHQAVAEAMRKKGGAT